MISTTQALLVSLFGASVIIFMTTAAAIAGVITAKCYNSEDALEGLRDKQFFNNQQALGDYIVTITIDEENPEATAVVNVQKGENGDVVNKNVEHLIKDKGDYYSFVASSDDDVMEVYTLLPSKNKLAITVLDLEQAVINQDMRHRSMIAHCDFAEQE